jgi:hypothetical protein
LLVCTQGGGGFCASKYTQGNEEKAKNVAEVKFANTTLFLQI